MDRLGLLVSTLQVVVLPVAAVGSLTAVLGAISDLVHSALVSLLAE